MNWKQKRKIKQRYDLTAQMYDARYAEEQEVKYKTALERVEIKPYSSVLDVGCGTGLFLSRIATEAQTVIGVDISRKLLLQAKPRTRNFRSVHLVQADADHMPFKDNQFSHVFAFTVLQNLPKPSETLTEIKRTGKRNSYIAVTGLKKAFSFEAFIALLENTGLKVISIEDIEESKGYVAINIKSPNA